jgi:chromosome segregation ATPase
MIQPQPQTQHDYPSSPAIATNQQLQAVDLSYQYELENQLVELKQQVNSQSKSLETYQLEYQEEKNAVNALEIQVSNAKNELQEAKKLAEEAEKSLELEQQKRQQLLGVAVSRSSATSTESNTPELTRAPSSLTNVSSIMSPPPSTATFDPFAGFKKSQEATTSSPRIEQKKMPLSPVQAKAVSKYGFDITAFDALSLSNNSAAKPTSSSFNDDLASIFGSPTLPTKDITKSATTTSSNFDSIFM